MKIWNKKRTDFAKKHLFEILWISTICVVIFQVIWFSIRDRKEDGLIIREAQNGDENGGPVIHIARTLGSRYLPSTAKNLTANSSVDEGDSETSQVIAESPSSEAEPDAGFFALPAAASNLASEIKPGELSAGMMTLPAAQSVLRVNDQGEVEELEEVSAVVQIKTVGTGASVKSSKETSEDQVSESSLKSVGSKHP